MTSIVGIVLFGSRARGDHDETSDVDLLAVADGGPPAVIDRDSAGVRISLCRYPLDHLLRRARSGDLFALHLVREGRVVVERQPVFAKLQRAFRYRAEYDREIRMASDVGWFLVHHRDRVVDAPSYHLRLAWCTHTIIAGKAAAQRRPVFSAAALAAFAGSPAVASVIRAKRSPVVDTVVLDQFRQVLNAHGGPEPQPLATLAAERRRFAADRNPAGGMAFRSMTNRVGGDVDRKDSGGDRR